ncbi:efflux RND transporter periplasmic adaptor subunit [Vandammella animalimorsus]|uniref:Efflux transporter periplasmic adaptor subunit n=1 Tax=Vandammella animalimorsus TaxID=2029117 RepID=A0A2A2AJX2_9BURK|nr:efflux RND transporter periplasmic adaptor subunit [Vandammella animalimorsus]PAT38034.1 efflux transporter periplasmic adaptor subunit [Vandammella animalimorsus]
MRPLLRKTLLLIVLLLSLLLAWWLQRPEGQALLARTLGWQAAGNTAAGQGERPSAGPAAPLKPGPQANASASAPALIEVAQAIGRPLRDVAQATGTLRARQSSALRPQASGRVRAIHFREGQPVRKGQLLLQLDDRLERAHWQQAQAELELARANHGRSRELVQRGFISRAALEESAAKLQIAQARRDLAQAQLERLRIQAPFDAVAGLADVHVGDYVREGEVVLQLQDLDVLLVDFRLPERVAAQLAVGQAVQLRFDALPGVQRQATVQAIDPLVDAQERALALRARLPNPDRQLRPGMSAQVELVLQERAQAVLVPEQAVLSNAQGPALIRVQPWQAQAPTPQGDGRMGWPPQTVFRTERLPVQLGQRLPGWVEVRGEGLAVGDVVMVAGQHRANRSGQRVRIRWAEPEPPPLPNHANPSPHAGSSPEAGQDTASGATLGAAPAPGQPLRHSAMRGVPWA